jgi:hypothetical protein
MAMPNLPLGQGRQAEKYAFHAYVPTAHSSHTVAPGLPEKLPGAQLRHEPLSGEV